MFSNVFLVVCMYVPCVFIVVCMYVSHVFLVVCMYVPHVLLIQNGVPYAFFVRISNTALCFVCGFLLDVQYKLYTWICICYIVYICIHTHA
jgi:hypothetical protein